MDSEVSEKPEGFRETRILIANGAIAAKQAALQRVRSELSILHEKEAQLEDAIYEIKENRDRLLLERWGTGEPEWSLILERPEKNSQILAERGEEEIKKLGLFTAGVFEKNQQKALGVSIRGETTNKQLKKISLSLETIFPHLYAVTDGERAVIVCHSAPESFDLQIRQSISNGLISVTMFMYGRKDPKYFNSFMDAVTFIRNNMIGNRFRYKTLDDLL
ncbi:TPA: hypothetical protein R4Z82_005038 [Enterobacter hormaechei subsp. xiangfangensis]|nr:hypothetical protein [Enterobacter hormaechei subsp. xiangfangensis]